MALLVCLMSMAVYATETEHIHEGCCCGEVEPAAVVPGNEIMPLADGCGACGSGYLVKHLVTATSPYKTNIERDCIHYYYGTDKGNLYHRWYEYKCNRCGIVPYTTSASDVYIVTYCGGYD